MKPKIDRDGYLKVGPYREDGQQEFRFVHVVVLESFVGPRPGGAQARHLDGNKLNNDVENLAWGTCSENAIDRVKHRTCPLLARGIDHPQGRLTDADVAEILVKVDAGVLTNREIAKVHGISRQYVSQIKKYRGRDPRRHARKRKAVQS